MNTLTILLVICIFLITLAWIPLITISILTLLQAKRAFESAESILKKVDESMTALKSNFWIFLISQAIKAFKKRK